MLGIGNSAVAMPIGFSLQPDEQYLHELSGTLFPTSTGNFLRSTALCFDGKGSDVCVAYNEEKPLRVVFTEYIYPVTTNLHMELEACKQEVINYNPGAKLLFISDNENMGEALFSYPGIEELKGFDLRSLLFVFHLKGWVVKLRVTFPYPQDSLASESEFAQFIKQIPLFVPTIEYVKAGESNSGE
jgi:hypothetical protein